MSIIIFTITMATDMQVSVSRYYPFTSLLLYIMSTTPGLQTKRLILLSFSLQYIHNIGWRAKQTR